MELSSGLHAYLKDGTARWHARTDELLSAIGFATRDRYKVFLAVQHAATTEVESALAPFAEDLRALGLQGPSRTDALRRDMETLGLGSENSGACQPFATLDEATGAAYVMEGSRIGGRMLSRMIRMAMPDAPLSFLDYPCDQGFWQAYTRKLDEFTVEQTRWPIVLSGAIRSFSIFQAHAEEALENI